MSDLWSLFRSVWPGILQDKQPSGVSMSKLIMPSANYFDPDPASLLVLLSGEVSERISSATGREAVVRLYEAREVILPRSGPLYTETKAHVLQVHGGWEKEMPEVQALVQMHIAAELLEVKRRFASAQVDTVLERVAQYVEEHGIDPATACRADVGRRVGCSSRMASNALNALAGVTV